MEDAQEPPRDHEGSAAGAPDQPGDGSGVGPVPGYGSEAAAAAAGAPEQPAAPAYGPPFDPGTPAPPPGNQPPAPAFGAPYNPSQPQAPEPWPPDSWSADRWAAAQPPAQDPGWGSSWPPPPASDQPGLGSPTWSNQQPVNPYGGPPPGPGAWSGSWPGGWPGEPGGPPPPPPLAPGGWETPWSPGGDPSRPRHTLPSAITALLLAVAVLVGLGLGHSVWRSTSSSSQSVGNGSGGSGSGGNGFGQNPFGSGASGNGGSGSGSGSSGSAAPSNAASIAAEASPALVDIDTDLSYQSSEAAGTGIVLTSDGLVLTNNHVISGATRIRVTDVGNGQNYSGTVVGYARALDVALVQLQGASGLRTARLGNSSQVTVGEGIVGLGNAGGVGGAPSSAPGTVTALNQSITATDEGDGTSEQLSGLIQVNADIQPGDSGGALVDTNGRVVGIDTAASAGFDIPESGGQGYAIPINEAVTIAHQIESGQNTSSIHIGPTAFLGVLVSEASASGPGATLANAVPGGPAAEAGLTTGDTITSLAGHSVDKPSTLTNLVLLYHPGQQVVVGWSDTAGRSHQTTVTLTTGPAQ